MSHNNNDDDDDDDAKKIETMPILKTKRSRWVTGTVALLIVTIGTLIGTPTNGSVHHLVLNMPAKSSKQYFSAVTPPGIVPNDVLNALLVPDNSQRTGWKNYDQGNGTYDRQVDISVSASESATQSFYTSVLADNAWKTLSSRKVSTGLEILALHSGSDGHFWEIGITIKSRPSDVPSLGLATNAPSKPSNSTPVTLRLLQYESA